MTDVGVLDVFELAENPAQQHCDLPPGQIVDAVRREQAIELDDLSGRARLLVQAANAQDCAKLEIRPPRKDAAEGNIDMRFDGAPFRGEDVEECAAGFEHAMDFRIRQFLIRDVLEDRCGEDEMERIGRPRDLAHPRVTAGVAGDGIEAEAFAVFRCAQSDVILQVVAERVAISCIEIFVGVPARSASVVQDHAVRREPYAPGFEDRIVERNDLLCALVFDHRS